MRNKTIVITGAARRIGKAIAKAMHDQGANVIIHYRHSSAEANQLCDHLNALRSSSAFAVGADLNDMTQLEQLTHKLITRFPRIDGLVNNASSFYPTPVGAVTLEDWNDLMGSNLRAPFFLSQALAPTLAKHQGTIVNLIDIHATRPLSRHPVYCAAKAGLLMLTQSLAKELGPDVRVNGVSPGPILWPENHIDDATKQHIINTTVLKRHGEPQDIALAVLFLMRDANFVTGQILAVDGGRSLR